MFFSEKLEVGATHTAANEANCGAQTIISQLGGDPGVSKCFVEEAEGEIPQCRTILMPLEIHRNCAELAGPAPHGLDGSSAGAISFLHWGEPGCSCQSYVDVLEYTTGMQICWSAPLVPL